jgi:phage terminase Nu1 subunit (DNA packaging protein)
MIFSSGEFADFVGISKRQINNYRKEGMPSIKKNKYYYYDFGAIQWLYDNGIKQVKRAGGEHDTKELSARERKDLADAKSKEFDLEVKQGKYIPHDVARANGAKAGLFVRDILTNFPNRFIPRLDLNEATKHYLMNELRNEVHETLIQISNFAGGKNEQPK